MSDLPRLETISEWIHTTQTDSDALINIGHALVALTYQTWQSNLFAAEQLEQQKIANELAAAAVYVSLGDLSQARGIVEKVRRA